MSIFAGAADDGSDPNAWRKPKGRDPKRIERVLAKIRAIWWRSPDLRLMQLLGNVVPPTVDQYYMEDDHLLRELERLYDTTHDVLGDG